MSLNSFNKALHYKTRGRGENYDLSPVSTPIVGNHTLFHKRLYTISLLVTFKKAYYFAVTNLPCVVNIFS